MLLVIVAIWLGYSRAKANGKNPYLWAFICAAVFLGLQVIVGIIGGVLIGIGIEMGKFRESAFDDYSFVLSIAAIIVSLIGLTITIKIVDRPLKEEIATPPPPPPMFGNGQ